MVNKMKLNKKNFGLEQVVNVLAEFDVQGLPLGEMGARVKGFMDPDKKVIYIDRNRRASCQKSTLLHELIHAYKNINNLNLNVNIYFRK